jgi:AcrR family transcriptional regulator
MGDLTSSTGINPLSLFAAFGNKEGLFRRVLQRYVQERNDMIRRALEAPTAQETVATWQR